jgi:hypothetical protein
MNQSVVDALQRIKIEYGMGVFNDSRRVNALLSDFLQNKYEGEVRLLLLVLDMKFFKNMLHGHNFSNNELCNHADYIENKYFINKCKAISALICLQNLIFPQSKKMNFTFIQEEKKIQSMPRETDMTNIIDLCDVIELYEYKHKTD